MSLSGGHLLVRCLEAQGVTAGFGVPGESYLDVLDALHDSPIEFVGCRQEGGAAYAASAWGRLTGQPGIAFVTRGPGATNASVGLHTAMQDSSPMILFVGQASLEHLEREAFQEVDYRAFFGPLVKWATQIESVDRIPEIISRAFMTALSGRPGPVVVALPENVLSASTSHVPGRKVTVPEPAPSSDAFAAAVELLNNSERPLVIAGSLRGSVANKSSLQAIAEANHLPVATGFRSNDVLDNHSTSYVGEAGVGMLPHVQRVISEADLIIAVDVRFDEMMTKAYTLFDMPDSAQRIIHVHPSDGELGKIIQPDVAVQSSSRAFWDVLAGAELETPAGRIDWCARGRSDQVAAFRAPAQPGHLDMAEIMVWLQDHLRDEVIITNGAGNFAAWPNKYFAYGPRARLLAPESGSMGYGLPAGIAAKVAEPAKTVVTFVGDGELQMTIQELGSAAQAGAQPIVLVFNNGTYGTIRMHQERAYPTRVSGTEILNPDFVAIGTAYGFHSERVERTAEFAAAFSRAEASSTGALIELVMPPDQLTATQSVTDLRG